MYTWMRLNSSADLQQLATHISPEYAPDQVAKKLAIGMSSAVKGVLIERNYIDKDYRSTYYNFYAKKGQHYRADCVRLHFFDQTVTFDEKVFKFGCPDSRLTDYYFGYMVLRPKASLPSDVASSRRMCEVGRADSLSARTTRSISSVIG